MDTWGTEPEVVVQSGGNDAVNWGGDDGGNWNNQETKTNCNGCGQDDHTSDGCPNGFASEAQAGDQERNDNCFGCGQPGHIRADCPEGGDRTCRVCKRPGHFAVECPDKKPLMCHNCGEEGHPAKECDKPRAINRDHIEDVTPDEAWSRIEKAVKERDIDDAKEALEQYIKAMITLGHPTSFRDIQGGLIDNKVNLWFIALERPLSGAFTNMDMHGNTGKKYTVSYRFSEKPARPRERDGWPADRAELLARLDDAGDAVDSGLQRCFNCEEWGHSSKACPQPERVREGEVKLCINCNGEGHQLRDCPQPRVDPFACRNCGESGHKSTECDKPINMDNVTCRNCEKTGHFSKDCPDREGGGGGGCRNCGQEGHFAKDCDQPRNMDLVTCRNCEKNGHVSRDCPEPKDWSKVQCRNCQKFGHTIVRCTEPVADADGGGFDSGAGFDNAGGFDNDAGFDNAASGGFDNAGGFNSAPAAVTAGGGVGDDW